MHNTTACYFVPGANVVFGWTRDPDCTIIFAIALEVKMKIPLLINRLIGKVADQEVVESDYVSMVNMETEL